ncbi:GNAT family N-acetyltransferase [Bacillus sp. M6-12]|uniref:GNAT family N-acetyltransferase n=1 Tax=Bacillus sp. M6-12 TaxID=2054166 RepID=UPI000C786F56|nr:GNAT family N-acetyltransferase [Bacillus sp. M6-12]PLS17251.1 GNAT family N-acetyltransferase [Bacillus sp. M6-12]
MEIRKPSSKELEEIIKLSPQALYEGTIGRAKPTDENIKQLVLPLLEKGCSYLIASDEGSVLGWVLIGFSKDQFTGNEIGFIYELYVKESFRGKGISKQLMKSAIESLTNAGKPEIRLSVFADNEAIKLYEKMGFKKRSITMSLSVN